jgi:putative flippase GtrA
LKSNSKLFFQYILTGILNTAFGYGVFAGGIYIGLPNWLALLSSTILGVIFNFKTFGRLVFDSQDNSRIFIFIVVYGVLYLLNLMLIKIFISVGFSSYEAGFIAIFPVIPISFYANKRFVFRKLLHH